MSESVGMCRPLDPLFSPYPLVGYSNAKYTFVGYRFFFFVLRLNFPIKTLFLGHFCENLILRWGYISPRRYSGWGEISPRGPLTPPRFGASEIIMRHREIWANVHLNVTPQVTGSWLCTSWHRPFTYWHCRCVCITNALLFRVRPVTGPGRAKNWKHDRGSFITCSVNDLSWPWTWLTTFLHGHEHRVYI